MFRSDPGVIESGGHTVGRLDLAETVLQEVTQTTVQYPRPSFPEGGGMQMGMQAVARRFHTDQSYFPIVDEIVKNADRVAAAADTGDDGIRRSFMFSFYLLSGFPTDYCLKITHDQRVRMGTDG